jgi:hypothetical protein
LKVNKFFNILLDFLSKKKKSHLGLALRYVSWAMFLIILTQSFSDCTIKYNMVKLLQGKKSLITIFSVLFFIFCHRKNMECFLSWLYNSQWELSLVISKIIKLAVVIHIPFSTSTKTEKNKIHHLLNDSPWIHYPVAIFLNSSYLLKTKFNHLDVRML